jgi:hypothetical protein
VSLTRTLLVVLLLTTLGWGGPAGVVASSAEESSARSTRLATGPTTSTSDQQDQVTTSTNTPPGRSKGTAHGRGGSKTPPPEDPSAEPDPTPEPHPTPDPDPDPAPGGLLGDRFHVGVTDGAVPSISLADDVAKLTGERPSLLLWYVGFGQEVQAADLAAVRAAGGIPILTWEPYDWQRGIDQAEYRLARIIDGSFDPYLRRSARTLRDAGDPVLLRFAHEMNGGWYPWSETANGNRPGEYVQAWRHVHEVFRAEGATNVSWMWSPNVEFPGSQPLEGLYPGTDYVDVVGIDGYNWGSSQGSQQTWQRPDEIFDATMATVRRLAPGAPIVLAEVASSELGGDKAVWNAQLFDWMAAQPDLAGFVWFQLDKETDWRIDSSRSSTTAFREGLARLRQAGR